MWYETENGDLTRPASIDMTSSQVYVYIRKNIELVPETVNGDEIIPAHYKWDEIKIPKEVWEIAKETFEHSEALDDVYEALAELAEMIVEVE